MSIKRAVACAVIGVLAAFAVTTNAAAASHSRHHAAICYRIVRHHHLRRVSCRQPHARCHRVMRRHHRTLVCVARKRHARAQRAIVGTTPSLVAGTQESQCLANQFDPAWMQAHGANVLRLILTPDRIGQGVGCVQQAEAEGFRVYISIQYWYTDGPSVVAGYMQSILSTYPNVWALSLGNEEDLDHVTPAAYAADWNAAEAVMASMSPSTIRVFGEASPWGMQWEQQAAADTLTGAQVISTHCYDSQPSGTGLQAIPDQAKWAASKHLALWCSEMGAQTIPTFSFFRVDTESQFDSKLALVEGASPNLAMVAHYDWPEMGTE